MPPEEMMSEKRLFTEALGKSPDDRAAYLDAACAGHFSLRARVEALLAADVQAGKKNFLEQLGPPPPPPAPPLTEKIPLTLPDFDTYTDITYLGHGGMGVVYRARDTALNIDVALKIPRPDRPRSEFVKEPQTIARLFHANIVQVYRVGMHEGCEFFTMRLLPAPALNKRLAEYQQNPRAAAILLSKVARAVGYAHTQNILHRDLKPANILLDLGNEPYVTDFGLARIFDDQKAEKPRTSGVPDAITDSDRVIAGTLPYMAPEQADPDRRTSRQSDVYGLGATLYAMLTGRPPFQAESVSECYRLVVSLQKHPVPPRQLNPRVDPDLEAICVKALSKKLDDRYQTAEDLAVDLDRWLAGLKPVASQWSWNYTLYRWCVRNPLKTAAALLVLLLLAGMDIYWSRAMLLDRKDQVLRSNGYTAQSVANTFSERLQRLSSAVLRESRSESLRDHLARPDPDRNAIQDVLRGVDRFYADSRNGFLRRDEEDPFVSWYLLGKQGEALGHSTRTEVVGKDFGFRDYFKKGMNQKAGSVYVSRVYRAQFADTFDKFAIAAPVYLGNESAGLLVATVTTDSSKELLPQKDGPQQAVLVGRWDGGKPRGDRPDIPATDIHPPGQPLILLHPLFARGDPAEPIENESLLHWDGLRSGDIGVDEAYRSPLAAKVPTNSKAFLAASALVPDTEFVVIVRQDYDQAVQWRSEFARLGIVWGSIGLVVALLCLMVFLAGRTRPRRTAGETSGDECPRSSASPSKQETLSLEPQ